MEPDADLEGNVGPLDIEAMEQVRNEFRRFDGLVEVADFDSVLEPSTLIIELTDGIGDAEWCRFDVRWYRMGYYNVHHTDKQDVNFRFDYHPKTGAPDRHFHGPPDAISDDPERSCIEVTEPRLVARAVHKLWRRAYDTDAVGSLNAADDPP